ncbi:MAG: HlyD family secretion protein [Gemmatimonadaceae bacterium]
MATVIEQESGAAIPREAAGTVPGTKRSRRRLLLPIIALVAVAGAVWGVRRWNYGRAHASTDNAQVDGHIIPVLAKVGGYVQAVAVAENGHVREGALLVQIDDAEYRARLAQADAELAAAQATAGERGVTGQAEAAVETASGQRGSLDAQITAARASEGRARVDLARFRELADKQIVSRQQLDAAQAAADAAAASLVSVQRQAVAAQAGVVNARAGVRLAQARREAARAARHNASLQLDYTTISAPAAGAVTRKQVEVGQLVQPGQPLLSVVADTGTWVTANFKETQLSQIRVGQPVLLEVDAYGGCAAEGRVASVSAATGAKFALLPPDNATGNFTKVVQRVPVRVQVTRGCGADRPLRPGMSVNAHVTTR